VIINKYGDNSVLEYSENLLKPKLKLKDDILVKIYSASLNPIDFKMRSGLTHIILPYEFPLLLGHDYSGVIEEVGEDVKNFKKGDEVYGRAPDGRIGTLAEYITVREYSVALKPKNISHNEAASIPLVGLTTVITFLEANVKKGDHVLITGGSGGIGTFAIQYASHVLELNVSTTCSEKKIELCGTLGANYIIDYHKEKFENVLKNLDFAYDTTGEAERIFPICKKVYSISTIPDSSVIVEKSKDFSIPFYAPTLLDIASSKIRAYAWYYGVDYKYIFMYPSGKLLRQIGKYIEDEKIKPIIDKVYELKDVKEAFKHIESGRATGKVVVSIYNEK